MRDYRDAKVMARTLREALAAKHHKITVGESLEMIAHLFGVADWNTLSAVIKRSEGAPAPAGAHDKGGHLQFAPTTEDALHGALSLASDKGHDQATVEHLLLALTKDPDAAAIMKARTVDLGAMRKQISEAIEMGNAGSSSGGLNPTPSPAFQKVVQRAILNVKRAGGASVTGAHLLNAIVWHEDTVASRILREHGIA
jgi:hypothetical protein